MIANSVGDRFLWGEQCRELKVDKASLATVAHAPANTRSPRGKASISWTGLKPIKQPQRPATLHSNSINIACWARLSLSSSARSIGITSAALASAIRRFLQQRITARAAIVEQVAPHQAHRLGLVAALVVQRDAAVAHRLLDAGQRLVGAAVAQVGAQGLGHWVSSAT